MKYLTEKDAHCISRHLQQQCSGDQYCEPCRYCKFAIACRGDMEQMRRTKGRNSYYFLEHAIPALEKASGVKITRCRKPETDYLVGSWAEDYPELLEFLRNVSVQQQSGIFDKPDILDYIRNPTKQKLQMLVNQEPYS